MSEHDDDTPKPPAEGAGSPLKRGKHPVTPAGEPAERGRSASATEIEGEVLRRSNMAPDVPDTVRPRRKVGRREPVQSHQTEAQQEAHLTRPSDEEGTHFLPESYYGDEPTSIREEKFAEWQVAGLFILATLATLWTCVAYFVVPAHARLGQEMNFALGGGVAVALLA